MHAVWVIRFLRCDPKGAADEESLYSTKIECDHSVAYSFCKIRWWRDARRIEEKQRYGPRRAGKAFNLSKELRPLRGEPLRL
jgi:hypothetical protein